MIAIRKNHNLSDVAKNRGDVFEIVLIQVKGGSARFPCPLDVERLLAVQTHHRADKVVLAEWKKGKTLCCYLLPDMTTPVAPSAIFGTLPKRSRRPTKTGSVDAQRTV